MTSLLTKASQLTVVEASPVMRRRLGRHVMVAVEPAAVFLIVALALFTVTVWSNSSSTISTHT